MRFLNLLPLSLVNTSTVVHQIQRCTGRFGTSKEIIRLSITRFLVVVVASSIAGAGVLLNRRIDRSGTFGRARTQKITVTLKLLMDSSMAGALPRQPPIISH
jgi:GTP-sensing pleiotropic transcriptional regulator CodY